LWKLFGEERRDSRCGKKPLFFSQVRSIDYDNGRSKDMTTQPQQTSVDNVLYDLTSVLYHTLESSQTYAAYIQDAQRSGNQQLMQFFQQLQQQDNQRAQQAKQLLGQMIR
jgi:hypothetical protein